MEHGGELDEEELVKQLFQIAIGVVQARTDKTQNTEAYYFLLGILLSLKTVPGNPEKRAIFKDLDLLLSQAQAGLEDLGLHISFKTPMDIHEYEEYKKAAIAIGEKVVEVKGKAIAINTDTSNVTH